MVSSLGAGDIVVSTIFPISALVAVTLRLRSRRSSALSWFVDDYMIIAALLSLISYGIIDILAVAIYSFGTHVQTITLINYLGILKLWFANGLVMIVSSTFTRLSIVYFYRRVLPPYRSSIPTTILLVIVYAWGIAYLATSLLSCIPLSKRWDARNGGSCYSTTQENEAFDIANLGITVILLFRPITQAREFRRLPPRKKALISGIILLALLVVIVIIVRVAISHYPDGTVDGSYDLAKVSILAQVETSLLLICACFLSLICTPSFHDLGDSKETGRYEKPELAAEHVPRRLQELDDTGIVELPVPPSELIATEQFHQLDDTSRARH
ncbi:hypothetical protein F5Y12DRAFT_84626 [Xylaria sp. FL1777]|nr:hypothetical protein F5Y12DRAFT_84626 [Xylaria sp. FL1777]